MDVLSPEQRSYNMSRIKGKNTKPELLVRKWLWSRGYRYRLHQESLPGKPDIVFYGRRKIIFVHGCFWHGHGCEYSKMPQTNSEFWETKITNNIIRDKKVMQLLKESGWGVLTIWECELRKNKELAFNKIEKFMCK